MNRFSQALFVSCLLFAAPAFADIAVDEPRPDEIAKHEEAVKPDEAATPEESAKLEEKEATKTSGCSTTGGDIALFSMLAGFGLVFVGRKRR